MTWTGLLLRGFCLLAFGSTVLSHMYITVPNPFTESGRGCRVYFLQGNQPLTLREVPWECSAVFHEARFWRDKNLTEIAYAKVQEDLPVPNWLLSYCGDSKSVRTYAIHPSMAVCMVVNNKGGLDIAWASSEREKAGDWGNNSLTNAPVRGVTKMFWPGRSLSKKRDKTFLGAVFDGDSLQVIGTSQHNNHMLYAEVYVGDLVALGNTVPYRFAFQQVITEVPRLSPETYHAWVTGPGKYSNVDGYNREGSIHVDAGSDRPRRQAYLPRESKVCKDAEKVSPSASSGKESSKIPEGGESKRKNESSVDLAFGSGSGGFEPDEEARSVERMKEKLDRALELFRSNDLYAAKAIYEDVLKQAFSPASAPSIQAARFNMASVCYRLAQHDVAVKYLEELVHDHTRVASILMEDSGTKPLRSAVEKKKELLDSRFQYLPLAYNLLGDILFYRDADVERGLSIFSDAKRIHLADPGLYSHVSSIVVKWAKHWHQEASKKLNQFDAVNSAGLLMYAIGAQEDAEKVLLRAQDLKPKHKSALLHFNLGMLQIGHRDFVTASRHLARFTQIHKKKYDGWLWRGRNAIYAKKLKSAVRYFKTAIEIDPKNYKAYSELITLLKRDKGRIIKNAVRVSHKYANKAISLGVLSHYEQTPSHYLHGVPSHPWHDTGDITKEGSSAITLLEKNFEIIKKEVLGAFESGLIGSEGIDDTENLTVNGKWTELNLYHMGRKFEKNCNILPITTSILEKIPDIVSHVKGATKISVLQPGTIIKPHAGPTNTRIRLHLGLQVSDEASITVGNETRTWQEGKVLAFDDSYIHSVAHRGNAPRIALISDIWPPSMTDMDRVDCLETAEEVERYLYRVNLFGEGGGNNWHSNEAIV